MGKFNREECDEQAAKMALRAFDRLKPATPPVVGDAEPTGDGD